MQQHLSIGRSILAPFVSKALYIYIPRERSFWAKPRSDEDWQQMQRGDDEDFKESLRVSRRAFGQICERLRDKIKPKPNFISIRIPTSVEKKVALTLFKLASVCEYRVVGLVFGIHKTTVQKIFFEVVRAINKCILWEQIKMPNETECEGLSIQFERKCGIPQLIGCIDGSHIPIITPPEGQKDFINRKKWASVVLQAVVDINGRYITFYFISTSTFLHISYIFNIALFLINL